MKETYKSKFLNPETFKEVDFDTKIPKEIVDLINKSLNCLSDVDYSITPILIDPKDLSVIFGIIAKNMDGTNELKYKVSINSNK